MLWPQLQEEQQKNGSIRLQDFGASGFQNVRVLGSGFPGLRRFKALGIEASGLKGCFLCGVWDLGLRRLRGC